MKNLLLLFSILLLNQSCMAQSLSQHEWENRVILIFASDFQNKKLKQQLGFFQKEKKGLVDRKLIVYQITPDEVKRDEKILAKKNKLKNDLERFKINTNEFTFILIGLDGEEKMRSLEAVSLKKLFSKIDRMPMRRSEIERNKNNE